MGHTRSNVYDRHGQQSNSQPSTHPEDPLNWPLALKIGVLQVCVLASLGTLNTAIINPAYVALGQEFNITTVVASYQTTIVIAVNGVAPFSGFHSPISMDDVRFTSLQLSLASFQLLDAPTPRTVPNS